MTTSKPKTKSAKVIALLNRGRGASIAEIGKTTNWKPHSIRSFITGLRQEGFVLAREQRGDGGTAYRVTSDPSTEHVSS